MGDVAVVLTYDRPAPTNHVLVNAPGLRGVSAPLRELISRSNDLAALGNPGPRAPTIAARSVAASVLAQAAATDIFPDRVAATPDQGVMFYFFPTGALREAGRYASLECHDTGELVLLRSDRGGTDPPMVDEIEVSGVSRALEEIAAFLGRRADNSFALQA